MKKTWTVDSAISFLQKRGAEVKNGIVKIKRGSLSLTGCGAYDYLKNHTYTFITLT